MTQQEIALLHDIDALGAAITTLCDELNRTRAVNRELLAALKAIVADYDDSRPLTEATLAVGRDIPLARIAITHAEAQP